MKKNGWLLTVFAIVAIVVTACNKQPLDNLNYEESRIYITDYDSSVNFTNYKTYSISDSVTVVDNNQGTRQLTTSDEAYIAAVKKYMAQMGYVQVDRSSNPDIGVEVSYVTNTSTGVVSYPNYYNYYGSYYDPYYWGYGGYGYYSPYSYSLYSIQESALSIDMLDLKNASANNQIRLVWTGLIRGEGIADAATADSQVKALFDQSPYLKTNE